MKKRTLLCNKKYWSISIGSILLLLFFTRPLNAANQMPVISLHVNGTIKDVLQAIEKKSDFVFIYSDDISRDLNGRSSISANRERLDKILDQVLTPSNLLYHVRENQIAISK